MRIIVFLLIVLVACAPPNHTSDVKKESIKSKEAEFKSLYKEYLRSFREEELEKLQLLDSVKSMSIKTIAGEIVEWGKGSNKPTILVFFATWCPSCKIGMAEIDSVLKTNNNIHWKDDVNFLAIGREHTTEELLKWKKEKQVVMDVAADPDRKVYDKFATKFVPRVYIISKTGEVLFQDYGWAENTMYLVEEAILSQL